VSITTLLKKRYGLSVAAVGRSYPSTFKRDIERDAAVDIYVDVQEACQDSSFAVGGVDSFIKNGSRIR
jgi:hypothetical protein